MNHTIYDAVLFHTHRSEWDQLLIHMVRTNDHFLSKKIEHFLHAYQYENDYRIIEERLYSLFRYLDHASKQTNELFENSMS